MRPFFTVAAREIQQRRRALAAAAIAGVLVLAVPMLLGHSNDLLALGLASVFGPASAVLIGLSSVGGELSGRGMAFYFTRPLPAGAIFWGRLLGGVALIAACQALLVLPSLAFLLPFRNQSPAHWELLLGETGTTLLFAEGALLVCLATGCALGVIVLARSLWALADVVGAAAVVAVGWIAGQRIDQTYQHFGLSPVQYIWRDLVVPCILVSIAILFAAARALAVGRTLAPRVHRVFTLTLWPTLLGLGGIAYAVPTFVLHATPADLRSVTMAVSDPTGRFVEVRGVGPRGLPLTFLCELATMRCVRRNGDVGATRDDGLAFSDDGRRAAAVRYASRGRLVAGLTLFDLAAADLNPEFVSFADFGLTPEAVSRDGPAVGEAGLAASPDGSRFAVLADGWVVVYDVKAHRLAGRFDVPGIGYGDWAVPWWAAVFVEPQRVRAVRGVPSAADTQRRAALEIWSFDLHSGAATRVGRIELPPNGDSNEGPGGARVVVSPGDGAGSRPTEIAFYDGGTGQLFGRIESQAVHVGASFLDDGGVLLLEDEGRTRRIRLFDHALAPQGSVVLQGAIGGVAELGTGRFVVGTTVGTAGAERRAVSVVDVSAGTAREVATGLTPLSTWWPWISSRGARRGEAAKLFLSTAGELVRFDPLTGDRRVLLPLAH